MGHSELKSDISERSEPKPQFKRPTGKMFAGKSLCPALLVLGKPWLAVLWGMTM